MALSGSIQEFGLADIFQLIGIQRKTGTLVLNQEAQTVSVKFLEGSVVEAATDETTIEDLLGEVLVRTGRITQKQLDQALERQRKTLQRLGHILCDMGAIDEDQLIEGLRVQALQIVYRLFRWRQGKYMFEVSADVDYDDRHFSPIGAETILMEGARMIDEWPLIERRIKSDDMVLRRTDAAAGLDVDTSLEETPDLEEFELDFALDGSLGGDVSGDAPPEEKDDGPPLSDEERQILGLVDGDKTVQWINDHSPLGEFDTYRILADLVTRKLVEEVEVVRERESRARPLIDRTIAAGLTLAIFAGGAFGLAMMAHNRWTPWRLTSQETTDELRFYAAMGRLENLDQALRIFYLDSGTFPQDLRVLAAGGYVRSADLFDPWGRAFGYQVSPGGYELFGLDAAGEPAAELSISYRFSAAQQMMLSGGSPGS